ncbi:MAG: hypothetical protein ACI8X5_000535 [Planctomycetota bacterium]|jgi:hypothetical protein
MSIDPTSPDSPEGDESSNQEFSNEEYLRVGDDEDDSELQSALTGELPDAPILNSPTDEELGQLELEDEVFEDGETEFAEFGSNENYPGAAEVLDSLQSLQSIEENPLEDNELSAHVAEFESEGEYQPADQDDGWLMEFELSDDGEDTEYVDEEPLEGLEAELGSEELDLDVEYENEYEDDEPVAAASPWLARTLIAAVSVFIGVVGAKFVPVGKDATPEIRPRVAQNKPNQQNKPQESPNTDEALVASKPAEQVGGGLVSPFESIATDDSQAPALELIAPGISAEPEMTEVFVAGTTPIEVVSEPDSSPIQIDWNATSPIQDWSLDTATQANGDEALNLTPEDLGGELREASEVELAALWLDAGIPVEAISKTDRVLTPNVGRVRVVLADGEIFEGELYAVGKKRVWIETNLGKMALMDWQIDRVEHILTSEGSAVLGENGSQDLAGLKSVRVTTVGGVFYGKLLSQVADEVTIVTEAGARISLKGAKVDIAGRTATHLIDASGAIMDPSAN